jgi:hypothetical protein
MRKCFQQIFEDFRETEWVFFSDASQQSSDFADLSIIKKGISILIALLQEFVLQADQTLADTDRF